MRESRKSFIQHKKGRVIKHSQWWRYQQERREQERQEQERALKTIKNRTERPIPVVRDRQGRLAKDLTLKEWFQKLNEEVDELKEEFRGVYRLSAKPGMMAKPAHPANWLIAGEMCDIIKVLYSMAYQMGIDGDFLDKAMHECNEKTRRRGCHE